MGTNKRIILCMVKFMVWRQGAGRDSLHGFIQAVELTDLGEKHQVAEGQRSGVVLTNWRDVSTPRVCLS